MGSICTWVETLLESVPRIGLIMRVDRPTIGMYLIDRQSVCN